MGILTFILKSSIVLGCTYGFYFLILRKSQSFFFIRYFLLFSMIMAVIIPFIEIQVRPGFPLAYGAASGSYATLVLEQGETGVASTGKEWTLGQGLLILYILISITLLIRFFLNLAGLIARSVSSEFVRDEGSRILLVKEATLPYSFFNSIFVNRLAFERGEISKEMLMHEKAHCMQVHSLDVLGVEILKILLWFNPFVWLFQMAIRLNHEYLADDAVLPGRNREEYQLQLVNLALGNQSIFLASNFDYSLTKKRIMMMNIKHDRNGDVLKRLAAIPLFLILAVALTFCEKDKSGMLNPEKSAELNANDWWKPILEKHNIAPIAYNNFEYVFEMGSTNSIDANNVVTLDNALFLIRGEGNSYAMLRSPRANHNLKTNVIQGSEGLLTVYHPDKNGEEPELIMEMIDFKYRVGGDSSSFEAHNADLRMN